MIKCQSATSTLQARETAMVRFLQAITSKPVLLQLLVQGTNLHPGEKKHWEHDWRAPEGIVKLEVGNWSSNPKNTVSWHDWICVRRAISWSTTWGSALLFWQGCIYHTRIAFLVWAQDFLRSTIETLVSHILSLIFAAVRLRCHCRSIYPLLLVVYSFCTILWKQ